MYFGEQIVSFKLLLRKVCVCFSQKSHIKQLYWTWLNIGSHCSGFSCPRQKSAIFSFQCTQGKIFCERKKRRVFRSWQLECLVDGGDEKCGWINYFCLDEWLMAMWGWTEPPVWFLCPWPGHSGSEARQQLSVSELRLWSGASGDTEHCVQRRCQNHTNILPMPCSKRGNQGRSAAKAPR